MCQGAKQISVIVVEEEDGEKRADEREDEGRSYRAEKGAERWWKRQEEEVDKHWSKERRGVKGWNIWKMCVIQVTSVTETANSTNMLFLFIKQGQFLV